MRFTAPHEPPAPLAVVVNQKIAAELADGTKPEAIFDDLALAVATFIAGALGSPIDHRIIAEEFHKAVMNELPKARHRIAALASKGE